MIGDIALAATLADFVALIWRTFVSKFGPDFHG